ncbi:hypothetical protein [Tabrizicola sp.]|uniref:hypothetical protein n=1 Tax=Tabrizicola sp. TaxID=2005166 RepID=UPI003F3EE5CE
MPRLIVLRFRRLKTPRATENGANSVPSSIPTLRAVTGMASMPATGCRMKRGGNMEDLPYVVGGIGTLVGGVYVGRQKGRNAGIAAGAAIFVAFVLFMVIAGYGY